MRSRASNGIALNKQATKTPVVLPNGQLKNTELDPAQWVSRYQFSPADPPLRGLDSTHKSSIISSLFVVQIKQVPQDECQPKRVCLAGI